MFFFLCVCVCVCFWLRLKVGRVWGRGTRGDVRYGTRGDARLGIRPGTWYRGRRDLLSGTWGRDKGQRIMWETKRYFRRLVVI